MRAWSSPDVPSLPVTGPVVRVHDTASDALVETRPEGPARMYVCGITPYDATHMGHAATYVGFDLLNRAWRNAGHEVTYVQNVTDVDDPLLERATKVKRRLGRARRARDPALPRRHGGAAGPAARALHRGGRVHPAGDRADPATRRGRFGLPRRRRPLLLGDRRRHLRRGVRARPRRDARDLPRARRRPRPRGQEGPARLPAVARRATGRAGVGQPVGPRPARLARRVLRDRARPPRRPRSTCRAAAATWSSRTTRCRPATRRSPTRASGSRAPTPTPGWSPTTARRCRSPRATSSSSPRCG